jgi:D-glycero-D-manno-heptose 1,7-bisphosphate phosphatase
VNVAAFLDRDGTLIKDVGYISNPDDVVLLDGVVDALKDLMAKDYKLVIVTNQSGIGRWLMTRHQYAQVQHRLSELLAVHGVNIDKTYFCPHTPEMKCPCRKPRCGLFYRAAAELDLDLDKCIMFGDKESDMVECVGRCIRVPKDGSWRGFYQPSHYPPAYVALTRPAPI